MILLSLANPTRIPYDKNDTNHRRNHGRRVQGSPQKRVLEKRPPAGTKTARGPRKNPTSSVQNRRSTGDDGLATQEDGLARRRGDVAKEGLCILYTIDLSLVPGVSVRISKRWVQDGTSIPIGLLAHIRFGSMGQGWEPGGSNRSNRT